MQARHRTVVEGGRTVGEGGNPETETHKTLEKLSRPTVAEKVNEQKPFSSLDKGEK